MNNDTPTYMHATVLTGHGGLDKLVYRDDMPTPQPKPDEVLIEVGACGVNNTDINTRIGWYSKTVTSGTTAEGATAGFTAIAEQTATWGGAAIRFPHIQGADVVGRIVEVGYPTHSGRIGERVLVDPWLRDPRDPLNHEKAGYLGSEYNGGFAQYVTTPALNAFKIDTELSDAELATFPCSSSTAEYLLTRLRLSAAETVLITGASGGVGSAAVQLAKRRDAIVIAVAGADKLDAVRAIGADYVIQREADPVAALSDITPDGRVDAVVDVVGGDGFATLLALLRRRGRYATSGAIAGPVVELDLRTLYLHDLELYGATVMPREVFAGLVSYIERGEIRPLLAKTFPLAQLREAQIEFLAKRHVGNFVMMP